MKIPVTYMDKYIVLSYLIGINGLSSNTVCRGISLIEVVLYDPMLTVGDEWCYIAKQYTVQWNA